MTQPRITLITGSTLGSAEYLGDHLADRLKQDDHHVQVIYQASFDDLIKSTHLILVTATHGAGDFPDNLAPLMTQLASQQPSLNTLKFQVIALGDSSYDSFCAAGLKAHDLLLNCGANPYQPPVTIDILASNLPEDACDQWYDQQIKSWIFK